MAVDARSLIGRLGDTTRRALEGAAGLCLSKTHYHVEMEHWLYKIADAPDSDLHRILRHYEIPPDRFLRDLDRGLGEFRTGNGRRPDLAEVIIDLAREAWLVASVNYNLTRVRSGTLLLAILGDTQLRRRLVGICPRLGDVSADDLGPDLLEIVSGSPEDREAAAASAAARRDVPEGATAGASGGETPGLDQYTVDLTRDAAEGRIDPVLGRDAEMRQMIDILMRKRQNNPILTGEAGVGKTAVVEGLARRIAADDVPEPMRGVALRRLDMALLQAGAGVKGEFENRLKQVIEEVSSSQKPIILFIDEAHTMIGAGGSEGQNDAANLLKPALARGELRTIGATTWAEYKKYFEKDPALTRRFQVVKVEEPSEDAAILMMRGMVEGLENHHSVRILDEAVIESVKLSHRFIPARQLPDSCMSVLDTTCARVAMGQLSTPPAIEDLRRRSEDLARELEILRREEAVGEDHAERLADAEGAQSETGAQLAELEARWEQEREVSTRIAAIRQKLQEGMGSDAGEDAASEDADGADAADDDGAEPLDEAAREQLRSELESAREELHKLQGESPLVLLEVDGQAVAEVISASTGIPAGKMVSDEIRGVLGLAEKLRERVVGQDHALEAIARRIHTARANLDNPSRPQGVFLLVGPSGVGKTETAMALADAMYGGEDNAVVINMSEYQESHTVSSLKGSPPGYVGYGEGGVLTEAVRRRPYCVVLLDEVEKAHPDVMEIFFQVFDKGSLEDGEGRVIDFKNTVILMGSNVATDKVMSMCADELTRPDPEALVEAIRPDLLEVFPPALLGRMVPVAYYPLSEGVLGRIIRLQLDRIVERVRRNHRAELAYGDEVIDTILSRCNDPGSGARTVDRILTHAMLPQMSADILTRMAAGEGFSRVEVGISESGEFNFQVT